MRLAVRLIVEEALEGEAPTRWGASATARRRGAAAGYRNGYRPGRQDERRRAGRIQRRRRVRDTRRAVRLGDPGGLGGRTEALEQLAVELYARGLSTRDIEDTFTDEDGRDCCRERR